MYKAFLFAVIFSCSCILSALELNCTFDKKLPAGVSVSGTVQKKNGESVMVNSKNYVAAILRFSGEDNTSGTLELDLMTTGQPPTTLGAILFRKENGKLIKISMFAWLKAVPRENYGKMTFHFPPGRFKSGQDYEIYLYRANQKGTLIFRNISFKLEKVKRSIKVNYLNTPDLVGPLKSGPSGKPDFHIQLTGVNPSKKIKEIVVTRTGGRWVSGDDVKKNFWMIQYYDSADFPARKNPKTNFNGVTHTNLSCIDLVFEDSYKAGSEYVCEVFYTDGTVDKWKSEKEKIVPPAVPLTFRGKILAGKNDYSVPANWTQPKVGSRSFYSLISDKEELKNGFIMHGKSHRRVWSLGWFLPLAGHNKKPPKHQLDQLAHSSRASLREFQVFDVNGKNIAPSASVSGECAQKWMDLQKVTDGNTSLDSAAKASEAVINQPQPARITLKFNEPVKLSKAVLYHGSRNGGLAGYVAKDFSLEYLENGKWVPVKGADIKNNSAERTEHDLANVKTSALRLNITKENTLIDYSKYDWSFNNSFLNIRKTDSIPDDVTFHYWYLGHDSTMYFALPKDDYTPAGMEEYKKWRAKHPNFMGFQVVEFDNDLNHHLGWGSYRDQKGALGSYRYASKTFVVQRPLVKLPDTRQEALKQYENLYKFYNRMMFNDCANFSSITMWHHQTMEWGAPSTVMECFGGGCPVFSSQIASARGASRQYGNKPWGCYFATYLGHGYLNYHKSGKVFGPNAGKSASLYRRQNYFAYLMGATYVDFEHPDIAFLKEKFVKGKDPVLSPHGKAVVEVAEFARNDKDRGTVYTPIALLLDFGHGWDNHEARKIWFGMFKPTPADRNIDAWMYGIFGSSELPQEGYGCNMSQTGFSGLVDILTLNPPKGAPGNLKDYPAAIIAGDIKWNDNALQAVKKYAAEGGTLVINTEQLHKTFGPNFTGVEFTGKTAKNTTAVSIDGKKLAENKIPYEYHLVKLRGAKVLLKTADGAPLATVFNYGKGKVILTLQKYLVEDPKTAGQKKGLSTVHYLLSLLRHEYLPFQVIGTSPAEMVVSRLNNGWRVSLLNNRGVYKQPLTAPVIVSSEKTKQTLILPAEFNYAVEKISGKVLPVRKGKNQNEITVTIPSGDLVIIDISSK